jgi:methylenetetrahydrofolate dehydrogenase (NADP+) / methenyltetrahydrofolate cyclohydrolase
MVLLSGTKVSIQKRQEIAERTKAFQKKHGRAPGLAVVIVGDDPASHVYVRNKVKACEETGIESFHIHLRGDATQEEVLQKIDQLNERNDVDAMLVQLPLPKHLNSQQITERIRPDKDADGLTTENVGLLAAGRPRVIPCTPHGVMEILKFYNIPVAGRHVVVVGRSQIVGRPMAQLMLLNDATVTIVHSKTPNLSQFTLVADIVVVATGQPRFLGAKDFKKEAVIVDVGIHRLFEGLCGDVRFEELRAHVAAATPVPGGVGPMTITMLLENTLKLALSREN